MIVEKESVLAEGLSYDDVPEDIRRLMERGQETVFAVRRDEQERLSALKQQLRQAAERDLGPAYKALAEFINYGWTALDEDMPVHEIEIGVPGCCDIICRYGWQETDGATGRGQWKRYNIERYDMGLDVHPPLALLSVFAVAEDGRDRIFADSIEEAMFLAREAFIRQQMARSAVERLEDEERVEMNTPPDRLLAALDAYILHLIRPWQAV